MPNKKPTLQAHTIALVAHRIRTRQQLLSESEALTRRELINPVLSAYGWKLNNPTQVRMEQGSAQPGRPDISLIDPQRRVPIAPLEAKSLGNRELDRANAQLNQYTDGAGKTARVTILTDGDRWIFRRPGQQDHETPLAELQISQDKPEDAARTLTRVLRPTSIMGDKLDKELNAAPVAPGLAPDDRDSAYTVLDLETTGFSPTNDKIIEFGAVKIVNGKEVDSMQTFINPGRPIPKHIQELTNITDQDVKGAPTFEQAKHKIAAFIDGSSLVAHNAQFDRRMLAGAGIETVQDWYDTMKLSRRIYQNETHHNLEAITKRLGIHEEGTHRADQDARLTGKAFAIMMDQARTLTDDKRRSLVRESSRRNQTPETSLLLTSNHSFQRPKTAINQLRPSQQKQTGTTHPRSRAKRPITVK